MIRRILTVAILGVSLLAGIAIAPASASAIDTCAEYNFDTDYSVFEGKRVVLVLHGWTGKSQDETTALLKERLPTDGWIVLPFAYESSNAIWPQAGSSAVTCLRQVISQYGAATELAEPSVYLVGHSMGGILSRVALDRDDRIQFGQLVAGVITIDTPHQGSPWGSSMLAFLAEKKAGLDDVLTDLDATVRGTGAGGSAPVPAGSSAAKCLALHHPGILPGGCTSPPAISADIPVHQIAGDVTITRQLFMIARSELDTNSDGIVWVGSQTGHPSSVDAPLPDRSQSTSSVVRCDVGLGATGAINLISAGDTTSWLDGTVANTIQSGSPLVLNNEAAVVALFRASDAPCGHRKIMINPQALDMVAQKLVDWAAPTMTNDSVSELLIPAGACVGWEGSRPIKLTNGQGENFDAGESGTGILATRLVGASDLTGDGVDDAVLVIQCTGTPIANCCAGRASILNTVIALDLRGDTPALIGEPITGGLLPSSEGDVDAAIGDNGTDSPRLDGSEILTYEYPIYDLDDPNEAEEISGWFRHALVDGGWSRE